MTQNAVLESVLDNVQCLLQKIDKNQSKLFENQSKQSEELVRLNSLIEKNSDTTQLELKQISTDIKNSYVKADKIEERLTRRLDRLDTSVDKNTEHRHNIAGFSALRHGVPILLFLCSLSALIVAIYK